MTVGLHGIGKAIQSALRHKVLYTSSIFYDKPHSNSAPCYKRFVPKVSVLIFYLNVHWTQLKLQVISFKV